MAEILIVEDELSIGEIVEINLKMAHHNVTRVTNAEDALTLINGGRKFDVAILDIMLPGMNGIYLCEHIRKNDSNIGIIMLSAKSQEYDKVTCLSVGADDYITKPFGMQELLARVESLLRRLNRTAEVVSSEDVLQSGPFTLDLKSRVLYKNNQMIDLTSVEFSIMELFFRNKDTALVREKILEGVWGENYFGDVKIVDVNIRRLRIKIEEDPSNPQHIVTIWGYGYRWTV
ncbi:MAG: response regulator transcription factor [Oscillospiraceae bacterium]|nr:response regulator transcription factor [Oscillospiraceae bacterium]